MREGGDLGPLPAEWSIRQLSNVCSMQSGGTPPKSDLALWSGEMPWVSGKDLKSHRLSDSIDHITRDAAETYSKIAPAGSVLVLVRGMGLANGFALSLIERPMAFNQDLKALIPKADLSGAFLMHALTFASQRMLRNVTNAAHGTKRLSQDDLDGFELPIPPHAEQLAIADVLDCARTAIDVEHRSLRQVQALKRATMRELFTRGLRAEVQKETEIGLIPESWRVELLGSHFSVGSGGTPTRGTPEYWAGGSIPWVKTAEIDYGVVAATEEHITASGLENSAARLYPPGTLLMAMYGQGVTRGRVARLGIEAACNQACAAMNPADRSIDTDYLFYFLTFRYDDVRRLAHGGQQQNLNMDIVRALPVIYPPTMDEQLEIVAILDAIDKNIDLHKRKRAVLEDLFKALLHKLLTGEIRVSHLDLSAIQAATANGAPA